MIVLEKSNHVKINDDAIAKLVHTVPGHQFAGMTSKTGFNRFDSSVHFIGKEEKDTIQYLLALDAINFCFWPDHDAVTEEHPIGLEYEHVAGGLKKSVERDGIEILSAENLGKMTGEKLREMLEWPRELPFEEVRAKRLREIGEGLARSFGGEAIELVKAAKKSAAKLVDLVVQTFPVGFTDMSRHTGECREGQFFANEIWFLKRAQIFVADVYGALKNSGAGEFTDIDKLTTFADYRVPVVLRESNILDYHSEYLHKRVDKKLNLVIGCELEVEIRCATIQAVERIRDKLNEKYSASVNDKYTAVTVDWWLWEYGEKRRDDTTWRPHHRTRTTYY
ncbi:unnamed protein product [Bathycoccus prasinos]